MSKTMTRIAVSVTAAFASVLALTGSAEAASTPAWACQGGSSASPNDPGGRDVRLRLASTNGYGYAEVRFIANDELIYFDNYAGSNGHPFWVETELQGATWKYRWNLGDGYGMHHSYNGNFPEGEKVTTYLYTAVGLGKGCLDTGGIT
ncbi:hypothetical protein [Streptomyces sp. NPDC127092]|uniref:hypothetical protein n=1 Tax=Streptomyces sp. NPDC127092 TaxID=3347135 RepID=UPI0036510200